MKNKVITSKDRLYPINDKPLHTASTDCYCIPYIEFASPKTTVKMATEIQNKLWLRPG